MLKMEDKIRSEPFVTILGNVLAVGVDVFLTVHVDVQTGVDITFRAER